MSKFDSENKTSATAAYPENDSLARALSALPTLTPSQDRLDEVLRTLAAKRESTANQSINLQQSNLRQNYKAALFIAIAASFMVTVTALLSRPSPPLEANVANTAQSSLPQIVKPEESSEINQLMVASQQLEAGLRDLGESSASFSQLYGRKQAELSLATLDTELAEVMASNSGQAIDQQRALWRERVAVLSAVENGNYRQALFVVD